MDYLFLIIPVFLIWKIYQAYIHHVKCPKCKSWWNLVCLSEEADGYEIWVGEKNISWRCQKCNINFEERKDGGIVVLR